MAFHRKYNQILKIKPDIAVISECAAPEHMAKLAPRFAPTSSVWIGSNSRKGLGVFTFGAWQGELSSIHEDDFPFVAPVHIEGPTLFNLLGVWACHNRPDSYRAKLGPLNRALTAYRSFIKERLTIVAGDLNDNVIWDKPTKLNNHSVNVSELEDLGLRSAYHHWRAVEQGSEPEPTLYWRNRTIHGPRYHIDYCFVPESWTTAISAVTVGSFEDWVGTKLSDHVPLIIDLRCGAAPEAST
jgi:exodeoxyribonuclease-3